MPQGQVPDIYIRATLRDWYLSHLENNDDGSSLMGHPPILGGCPKWIRSTSLDLFYDKKVGLLALASDFVDD